MPPSPPEGRAPDLFEPLLARRAWWLGTFDGAPRLISLVPGRGTLGYEAWVWNPRQAPPARCLGLTRGTHGAPSESCKCGYYATFQVSLLKHTFMDQRSPFVGSRNLDIVVGDTAHWGRVVRHEAGLRSEFCYPRALYMCSDDPSSPLGSALASEYGVPVHLIPSGLLEVWGTSEWDGIVADGWVPLLLPEEATDRVAKAFGFEGSAESVVEGDRMRLPAVFRSQIRGRRSFMLIPLPNEITLWPISTGRLFISRLGDSARLKPESRPLARHILSGTSDVMLDERGCLSIPRRHLKAYGLEGGILRIEGRRKYISISPASARKR